MARWDHLYDSRLNIATVPKKNEVVITDGLGNRKFINSGFTFYRAGVVDLSSLLLDQWVGRSCRGLLIH